MDEPVVVLGREPFGFGSSLIKMYARPATIDLNLIVRNSSIFNLGTERRSPVVSRPMDR